MRLGNHGRIEPLLSVLCLTGLAVPSLAATPGSCMLIRDAAGDASDQPNLTVPGVNQPDLDIVSADIASDARSVTTVVRVQHLGTALEAAGRRNLYRFSFHLGFYGDVVTEAYRGIDGEQFAVTVPNENGDVSRPELPATGVFDVARNEVRVTVPLTQASGNRTVRKRTYFTHLAADTFRGVGARYLGVSTGMDSASTGRGTKQAAPPVFGSVADAHPGDGKLTGTPERVGRGCAACRPSCGARTSRRRTTMRRRTCSIRRC